MEKQPIQILLAGGNEHSSSAIGRLLLPDHYQLFQEETESGFRRAIVKEEFDVYLIFADAEPCPMISIAREVLLEVTKKPVLIISDKWDSRFAAMAVRDGFSDYCALEYLNPILFSHTIAICIEWAKKHDRLAHDSDLLETLMDSIPDTIYFKDQTSHFTRINIAQQQLLGLPDAASAVGKWDFDFFDHAREAFADEQEIMKSGKPIVDKQEKIKRADGEYVYVSATKVPIYRKSGEVVGTLGISRDISDRVKAEQELEIVKERLQKAMNDLQEELDMAAKIQKSLLPQGFPDMSGVVAAAAYVPCGTIGGDLYEIIKIDGHRWGILMFDVVGHGVPAAFVAAMSKMIFGKHCTIENTPSKVLSLANDELYSHFHGKRHLAAFYGILDTVENTFYYSKGGHPPALWVHSATGTIESLSSGGIFIGLFDKETFEEKKVFLGAGDTLTVFTDGLIETFNEKNEYFGLKRLEKTILETVELPVDAMVSKIVDTHNAFGPKTDQADDLTLLVLRVHG
jgi:phosphoserine phosphatase RsbU/P